MTDFHPPPHLHPPDGGARRVGFELELAGMDVLVCAHHIMELFGGELVVKHSLEAEVRDTSLGTFRVELDTHAIKQMAEKLETPHPAKPDDVFDMNALRLRLSKWLGKAAGQVIPFEIVTAPLTFEQLPELERLRQHLHEQQAQGTRSAFFHAFGLHINPSVASEKAKDICDILRAFLVLYPWLKQRMDIDMSRRLLTFIDPFPAAYIRHVLPATYQPELDVFIADYLMYNPTRNRALDLLPLFRHLRPDCLHALDAQTQQQVKARPAYHYRLPNCEIDNPNWRIAHDWNLWVEVERLADDTARLRGVCDATLEALDNPLYPLTDERLERLEGKFGYAQRP